MTLFLKLPVLYDLINRCILFFLFLFFLITYTGIKRINFFEA